MKKTVVSVLTLLLVSVMLFTGFVPVISHAAEQKSAKEQIAAVIPESIKNTDWVDLGVNGDEFILTLNPDLSVFEGIDEAQLKAIVEKVLTYAKNALKDSLKDNKKFYRDLWAIAHEVYADYKGHGSISATLSDPNLPSELIGYVKAVLWAAHAADIIDVNELKSFAISAKDTFLEYAKLLKDKLVNVADDLITAKVNSILAAIDGTSFDDLEDMIGYVSDTIAAVNSLKAQYNLSNSDLVALLKDPAGALTEILKNSNVEIPEETLVDLVNQYKNELEAALNDEFAPVKADVEEKIEAALDKAIANGVAVDKVALVDLINEELAAYDVVLSVADLSEDVSVWADELVDVVVAKVTTTEYIKTHLDDCIGYLDGYIDVEKELAKYIDTLVADALGGLPIDTVKAVINLLQSKLGITDSQLTALVSKVMESGDPITAVKSMIKEFLAENGIQGVAGLALKALSYLDYVSINGNVIYKTTEDGPQIDLAGIKGLIRSIPGFNDIRNMEELKFSCPIVIATKFGTVDFTLTLKIHEDSEKYVRAAVELLDRYFTLNYVNGTVVFEMTMPEIFAKALVKAANSSLIPTELKQKVLTIFTATGNDFQALINELDFQDLITLLEYIPFDEIFDHDFVKQFVDLSQYGTEDVVRKVKEYQRYFEAAIRYGIRLTNAVANRIPDRFMDNSFMDLIQYQGSNDKFSYSNGTVRYQGTHNISLEDFEKVLGKVTSVIGRGEQYVSAISGALALFLPESFVENGFTGSVDFSIHFEKINRVDYVVGGNTIKTGFLPAGAKLEYFATTPGVVAWADQRNGEVLDAMPDYDVTLVPVYADPTAYGDVTAQYDPNATHDVYVTIQNDSQYTYAWYKNGVATGITTRSFTVKNVADSGTYYCVVTGFGQTYQSNSVTVTITPAPFTVEGAELDNTIFEFDNTDKTVSFKDLASLGLTLVNVDGNVASSVGKHTVTATFTKDNGNYKGTATFEWFIKYFIDLSDDAQFGWAGPLYPNPGSPAYNGNTHSVRLVSEHLSLLDLTFAEGKIGDKMYAISAKNAGTYYAKVSGAALKDGVNADLYHIVGLDNAVEYAWTIVPQNINIDLSDIGTNFTWVIGNSTFGNVTLPTLTIGDAFNTLVQVSGYQHVRVDGNTAKNGGVHAGTYKTLATIVLIDNSGNYTLTGVTTIESAAWTINPAPNTVDVSEIPLVSENGTAYSENLFVYAPGVTHGVRVDEANLPSFVKVESITGNTASVAGTHTLTVVLVDKYSDDDYVFTTTTYTIEWTVNKATVNEEDITFTGAEFVYDGKYHNLTINAPEHILPLLTVTYTYRGIEDAENIGKRLVGTYRVMAHIELKGDSNYNDFELTLGPVDLVIKGDSKVEHNVSDNSVQVEVVGGLTPDYSLSGGVVTLDKNTYEVNGKEVDVLIAYDIYFNYDGSVRPFKAEDGKQFNVKLLIPAEYRDLDADELMVIYIAEDGTIEVMDADRCGDYMCFTTNHFSVYAIVRVKGPSLAWLWIILVALLAGGIAVGVYFFLKNRKENAPAPDEIPAVEAEEAAEPATEAEETVVEEEPAAEETEEVPEVDEVVEEVTEEETPAVDEEVTEEEAEPVVEEEAEVAPVDEEPKTAVLVMSEDGKGATAVVGGETVNIRFRSSFMSRLIQSTENIQSFYSTIKNYVLSFKGIKARSSWNYEAFNKGRVQLVKLNIKGKTLIVNLNLDPKEFNINKYHFVDCSDKPKFAKVPMMMKVRSARALKYTLELIDELMKKYEIAQGEIPTVDYRMPYETTEELAKRGVVKIILPAGVTLSDDMTFVHVNVSELIESGTTVKTTEQIMTADETPAVEEAPVVEEAPAVEEAPVVEEAPAVEETPVVEEAPVVEEVHEVKVPVVEVLEDGTVHADAEVADQLVTDEEAEAKIEIVTVEDARRGGKMGEINLDVICENFEDGDVVDVDSLKAKRLVSPKIGRVKVLARGIMYKKLTVKASKFSIQAVKMITLAGGKVELEE